MRFPRHVLLRIMAHATPRTFRHMRLVNLRWNELSKMANTYWHRVLLDIAPRRITEHSKHRRTQYYNRCIAFRNGHCNIVSHFHYGTLEVKLLKTVPLYEQVMRIFARRELKLLKRRFDDAVMTSNYHEYALVHATEEVIRVTKKKELAEQMLERFNSGKRKRKRLNHELIF